MSQAENKQKAERVFGDLSKKYALDLEEAAFYTGISSLALKRAIRRGEIEASKPIGSGRSARIKIKRIICERVIDDGTIKPAKKRARLHVAHT